MNKKNIWLFLIFSLLVFSCQTKQINFKLQKIWEIGSNEKESPYFFAYITDGITDDKNNLWIVDMKLGVVKKFDRDGKFKITIGKRGNGPGELMAPNSIFIKDDKIYIRELFGEIEIYDTTGKYIKTLNTLPGNFILLTKDNRILTNIQGRENNFILIYSEKGEKLDSFGVVASLPPVLQRILKIKSDFVRRAWIHNDYLFAGLGCQYMIHIYDLRTKKLVKELTRKINYPLKIKPRLRPFTTISVFVNDKYIYYSYVITKNDSSNQYLDIWDLRKEKYLSTIKLKGQIIAFDSDENVYVEEFIPYVKLIKYKLIKL